MQQADNSSFKRAFSLLLALAWSATLSAVELEDSLEVVSSTNSKAAQSQKKIDQLARESQALLEEYRRLRNGIDYQAAYTRELEQVNAGQQQQIANLKQQIEEAQITQQRIVPLMRSMADALEKFVVLDLPFHHDERIAAVLTLKQRLQQPELSLSARFRLLLEAYQLEQDYGASIESWRGTLTLGDQALSVEYLRIGRVALYYHSLDGNNSGIWNTATQDWLPLPSAHNQAIARALRVARNQSAPELLTLPMATPGVSS